MGLTKFDDSALDQAGQAADWIDYKGCVLISCAMLSTAMSDAERELIKDPHSFGPASRFLMNFETDCAERNPSSLPIWLNTMDIDLDFFVEWIADRLDRISMALIENHNVVDITPEAGTVADEDVPVHILLRELFADLPVHNVPDRDRARARRPDGSHVQLELQVKVA